MRPRRLLLLLPLAACADADAPAPLMPLEAFEATLSQALTPGLPEPILPRDTLAAVLMYGEQGCPGGARERLTYTAAFGGCQAASGWVFAGITEYTGEPPAGRPTGEPFHLLADGYIIDPNGDWFILGGELELGKLGDDGWFTEVTGSWSYAPAGAWMTHKASVALWAEGEAEGGRRLVGGLDDGQGDVVYFDEVLLAGDELDGAVELRLEDGRWSRLDLDAGDGACGLLDEAEALCVAPLIDALTALGPPEAR